MMTIRSISRALTVAAFVLVGNATAGMPTLKDLMNKGASNVGTIAGMVTADALISKDQRAMKAVVETAGVALDQIIAGKGIDKMDAGDLFANLAVNYAVRQALLHIPMDKLTNIENVHAKLVVETAIKAAPEMIAKVTAPYLQ